MSITKSSTDKVIIRKVDDMIRCCCDKAIMSHHDELQRDGIENDDGDWILPHYQLFARYVQIKHSVSEPSTTKTTTVSGPIDDNSINKMVIMLTHGRSEDEAIHDVCRFILDYCQESCGEYTYLRQWKYTKVLNSDFVKEWLSTHEKEMQDYIECDPTELIEFDGLCMNFFGHEMYQCMAKLHIEKRRIDDKMAKLLKSSIRKLVMKSACLTEDVRHITGVKRKKDESKRDESPRKAKKSKTTVTSATRAQRPRQEFNRWKRLVKRVAYKGRIWSECYNEAKLVCEFTVAEARAAYIDFNIDWDVDNGIMDNEQLFEAWKELQEWSSRNAVERETTQRFGNCRAVMEFINDLRTLHYVLKDKSE